MEIPETWVRIPSYPQHPDVGTNRSSSGLGRRGNFMDALEISKGKAQIQRMRKLAETADSSIGKGLLQQADKLEKEIKKAESAQTSKL